jgi:hypothetical protein
MEFIETKEVSQIEKSDINHDEEILKEIESEIKHGCCVTINDSFGGYLSIDASGTVSISEVLSNDCKIYLSNTKKNTFLFESYYGTIITYNLLLGIRAKNEGILIFKKVDIKNQEIEIVLIFKQLNNKDKEDYYYSLQMNTFNLYFSSQNKYLKFNSEITSDKELFCFKLNPFQHGR